jgi:CheY-like chemotaxis protein
MKTGAKRTVGHGPCFPVELVADCLRRKGRLTGDPHGGMGMPDQILVVDDDAASGGNEALEAMRERAPDLVLLDLMMPDMSGWDPTDTKRSHL